MSFWYSWVGFLSGHASRSGAQYSTLWYGLGAAFAAASAGIAMFYTVRQDAGTIVALSVGITLSLGTWMMLFITWLDQHRTKEK